MMLGTLLAHLTLLTIAVMRRNGAQGVAAFMLLFNWLACSAFVYLSGVVFPITWFITLDWLTAIILWIDKGLIWQRLLIAFYALELIAHAGFAYLTRNADYLTWSRTDRWLYYTQLNYYDFLLWVMYAQMALVASWIGYDMARDWRRAGWRLPAPFARARRSQ